MLIPVCIHGVYMAKLYWRVKKNGKWTWQPAAIDTMNKDYCVVLRHQTTLHLEEEE